MGLFGKKNEEEKEEKKTAGKAVKSGNGEKEEKGKSMKDLYEENPIVPVSSKKDEKTGETSEAREKNNFFGAYRVLLKPLVTEKATNLGVLNKYVFAVAPKANKIEIAKAIEEVYGVKPVKVNIIKGQGKIIRNGRIFGKRKNWKKAIVALPEGKTIKIYEGV
jgi:large subunit ribosomal protein L23